MAKISSILAGNVRTLRESLGLTQMELAAKAGVKVAVIRSVETERTWPGRENIAKLAAALEVEESDLFQSAPRVIFREHSLEECNRRVQAELKKIFS